MHAVAPDFFDPEIVIERAALEAVFVVTIFDGRGDFFDVFFLGNFFDGDFLRIYGFWAVAIGTAGVGFEKLIFSRKR